METWELRLEAGVGPIGAPRRSWDIIVSAVQFRLEAERALALPGARGTKSYAGIGSRWPASGSGLLERNSKPNDRTQPPISQNSDLPPQSGGGADPPDVLIRQPRRGRTQLHLAVKNEVFPDQRDQRYAILSC